MTSATSGTVWSSALICATELKCTMCANWNATRKAESPLISLNIWSHGPLKGFLSGIPQGLVDWDFNNYCPMECSSVRNKLKLWSQTDQWVSLNPVLLLLNLHSPRQGRCHAPSFPLLHLTVMIAPTQVLSWESKEYFHFFFLRCILCYIWIGNKL